MAGPAGLPGGEGSGGLAGSPRAALAGRVWKVRGVWREGALKRGT